MILATFYFLVAFGVWIALLEEEIGIWHAGPVVCCLDLGRLISATSWAGSVLNSRHKTSLKKIIHKLWKSLQLEKYNRFTTPSFNGRTADSGLPKLDNSVTENKAVTNFPARFFCDRRVKWNQRVTKRVKSVGLNSVTIYILHIF